MTPPAIVRLVPLLAALSLGLGGCVSLLPKTAPVQLYELSPDLKAGATASREPVNVRLEAVRFQQAAAGDRILTVKSGEAAYVAGARWVSPAQSLFEESLPRAFAASGPGVRLLHRSDAALSTVTLSLDVEAFRVDLDGAQPTVRTVIHARVLRYPDRTIVLDRRFEASRPADANRVSAIVRAYDGALGEVLTNLASAVDEAAQAH